MDQIILQRSAAPVYGFLSTIQAQGDAGRKILDCGAGGPLPPLALFAQHGFQTWGIDISPEQLERAREFCQQSGLEIDLRQGDMRALPYQDGFFDHVYEHYSMCHLSKTDTQKAVGEMGRVLKQGGLCFLGLISAESWPRSMFGEEEGSGEYWGGEGGQRRMHSLFTDQEADRLVAGWEVIRKEMQVIHFQSPEGKATLKEWMARYREADGEPTREAWESLYEKQAASFEYAHLYYTLRKS